MKANVKLTWIQEDHLCKTGRIITLDRRLCNILDILDQDCLDIHYQPIYSLKDGSVLGHEALTRINNPYFKDINIENLFMDAIATNTILFLDTKCRENAIKKAAELDFRNQETLLFINTAPDILTDQAHSTEMWNTIIKENGLRNKQIVIEITEERNNHKCKKIKKVIDQYKNAGFKIAIDDFGTGYGGLKMLSNIEPDFVKIDKHFISNIEKDIKKYKLVDTITALCHKLGIKVIAEGLEKEEEIKIVQSMGIEFGQGFFLAKPQETFKYSKINIKTLYTIDRIDYEKIPIIDIVKFTEPITKNATIFDVMNRFRTDSRLMIIPVVENEKIIGVLQKYRFLENQMIGKLGYGMFINAKSKISELMEAPSLVVDGETSIQEVSRMLNGREYEILYDDILVSLNGKYIGSVSISNLLKAITEQNIKLAENRNPLTGLPGNNAIRREINKRILNNLPFDICYIDINNFKPYNDYYGFEKGDKAIKTIADILTDIVRNNGYEHSNFIGHIGGDDFILITNPENSVKISDRIIETLEKQLIYLHSEEDYCRGCYAAKNRNGESVIFPLLSVSIGIVSTTTREITSYAQLASIAADIKKAAKARSAELKKSAIALDKRQSSQESVY